MSLLTFSIQQVCRLLNSREFQPLSKNCCQQSSPSIQLWFIYLPFFYVYLCFRPLLYMLLLVFFYCSMWSSINYYAAIAWNVFVQVDLLFAIEWMMTIHNWWCFDIKAKKKKTLFVGSNIKKHKKNVA